MNMAENSVLEYRDVTIRRAENVIIRHTDLQINAGDLVYLIGRVGSGKSTLLKTIYADVPISDGEAHFGKFDLRRIKRRQIPYLRREMGIIFQDFRLMHDRTIEDNLSFVLRATGWSDKREISHRIDEVLANVGMDHKGYPTSCRAGSSSVWSSLEPCSISPSSSSPMSRRETLTLRPGTRSSSYSGRSPRAAQP